MTARALAAWKLLERPGDIGGRRYPPIALVVLAAIGAMFVFVVAGRAGPPARTSMPTGSPPSA